MVWAKVIEKWMGSNMSGRYNEQNLVTGGCGG